MGIWNFLRRMQDDAALQREHDNMCENVLQGWLQYMNTASEVQLPTHIAVSGGNNISIQHDRITIGRDFLRQAVLYNEQEQPVRNEDLYTDFSDKTYAAYQAFQEEQAAKEAEAEEKRYTGFSKIIKKTCEKYFIQPCEVHYTQGNVITAMDMEGNTHFMVGTGVVDRLADKNGMQEVTEEIKGAILNLNYNLFMDDINECNAIFNRNHLPVTVKTVTLDRPFCAYSNTKERFYSGSIGISEQQILELRKFDVC